VFRGVAVEPGKAGMIDSARSRAGSNGARGAIHRPASPLARARARSAGPEHLQVVGDPPACVRDPTSVSRLTGGYCEWQYPAPSRMCAPALLERGALGVATVWPSIVLKVVGRVTSFSRSGRIPGSSWPRRKADCGNQDDGVDPLKLTPTAARDRRPAPRSAGPHDRRVKFHIPRSAPMSIVTPAIVQEQ
jgi:hypothetical protein